MENFIPSEKITESFSKIYIVSFKMNEIKIVLKDSQSLHTVLGNHIPNKVFFKDFSTDFIFLVYKNFLDV